ncbi:hypothetical protein CF326_g8550 [Tilletia indica]|nr:hypothetical protein CF326_g8550 [Tilletia indica]
MSTHRKLRSSSQKAAMLVGVAAVLHASRFMVKEAGHARLGLGQTKVKQWLRARGRSGQEMLGMRASAFQELEAELVRSGKLVDGRRILTAEKLAIFLYMCRWGASCRQAADVFGHSAATIATTFKMILAALLSPDIYNKHVRLPAARSPVPDRIKNDPALFPFFKDVVGAIDGSHVPAHAPQRIRDRFWTRKGRTSFNVLAACDFDMRFIYVLSGWEGSASDSYLWRQALGASLKFEGNQKMLGDAGFPLSKRLLIPFRGVRYHLKEFASGMRRPQNSKELYNRRHAGARSTQADLFPALAVVHNFIRTHDPEGDLEAQAAATADANEEDHGNQQGQGAQQARTVEAREAVAYRDNVSLRMWTVDQVL